MSCPRAFRRVVLPQLCGRKPPPPNDANACGVPLGEGCRTDADCGTGYCLRRPSSPGLPATASSPSHPPQAVVRRARPTIPPSLRADSAGAGWLYLRACKSDADCARTTDRDQGQLHLRRRPAGLLPAPGKSHSRRQSARSRAVLPRALALFLHVPAALVATYFVFFVLPRQEDRHDVLGGQIRVVGGRKSDGGLRV